jgi:ubiquinone/menaquinone biosynthesis C-methylase UbiE
MTAATNGSESPDEAQIKARMREEWSAVGDRIGNRGDRNLLAGDDALYFHYKAEKFGEKFLPQIPVDGFRVLDVGCGAGGTLKWMSSRNPKRLVGCDQAPGMVAQARRNVPSAEIVQIDGDSLPFEDNEFDVVTTVTVLQHNPDARRTRILSEICRVSANQVILFEDTSLEMRPQNSGKGQGQYQNFYGRPVGWYSGVCSANGFDLVETQHLHTKVSLRTYLLLWSVLNKQRKGESVEGTPFSNLHQTVERITLPITRRLDPYIKSPKGENTMMRFVKRTNG